LIALTALGCRGATVEYDVDDVSWVAEVLVDDGNDIGADEVVVSDVAKESQALDLQDDASAIDDSVGWRVLSERAIVSGLAISGDRIVFVASTIGSGGTLTNSSARFMAIDFDGKTVCDTELYGMIFRNPVVDGTGAVVIPMGILVGESSFEGWITKFSGSGALAWSKKIPLYPALQEDLDFENGIAGCCAAADPYGTVFFGARGRLFAMNATGDVVVDTPIPGWGTSTPHVHADPSPVVLGERVFVLSHDQTLRSFSTDGSSLGSTPLIQGSAQCPPIAGPDGTIVCCGDSGITVVDSMGGIRWSHSGEVGIAVCPTIDRQGTVYVAGDTLVRAFRDGKELWRQYNPLAEQSIGPPTITGISTLLELLSYSPKRSGYELSFEGDVLRSWRLPQDTPVSSPRGLVSSVIPVDGLLVYASSNGGLLGFRGEFHMADPGTWSVRNGDVRNSRFVPVPGQISIGGSAGGERKAAR
jgi:hypothetical protein